jgi:hypothetical protein
MYNVSKLKFMQLFCSPERMRIDWFKLAESIKQYCRFQVKLYEHKERDRNLNLPTKIYIQSITSSAVTNYAMIAAGSSSLQD